MSISAPSANSGLIESGTGNAVFLFNEGGTVVGRAGTTALNAVSGHIVFVASIDGTGKVTLDQRLAVVHTPNVTANDVTTLTSAGLVQHGQEQVRHCRVFRIPDVAAAFEFA